MVDSQAVIPASDITQQDWYVALVEECRSIMTESVFTSRWALVEGHHALGERLATDENYQKHAKGNKSFVQRVGLNLKLSTSTIYYAIQFYEKYPKLDTVPEGKNISWKKIITKYLPAGHIVHVSDDSYEWFTPTEYTDAARAVMGGIDLDPASCAEANETIKAKKFYTRQDDGLAQPWNGRVWLNPPYNMPLVDQFADKVIAEYGAGRVKAAIVLTNNSTDTRWFHKLAQYPICLTRGRLTFWNGDETLAARQGQALFYLGPDLDKFSKHFGELGLVLVRRDNQ